MRIQLYIMSSSRDGHVVGPHDEEFERVMAQSTPYFGIVYVDMLPLLVLCSLHALPVERSQLERNRTRTRFPFHLTLCLSPLERKPEANSHN